MAYTADVVLHERQSRRFALERAIDDREELGSIATTASLAALISTDCRPNRPAAWPTSSPTTTRWAARVAG